MTTKAKPKVTVVGSYNIDLVVRTPRIPVAGETILGGPFFSGPGGKGANQAVAAARLNADVSMVVKLGTDAFGEQAAKNLQSEGIDIACAMRTSEAATGVALIVVDAKGENTIIVASGANALLSPADVDTARQVIEAADVVLFQLESPIDTVAHAIRLAHEAGVKVILNPAPGRPLPLDLLSMVDVLTPNQTEAEIITGIGAKNINGARAAAQKLLEMGVGTAVITLGADGALAISAGIDVHVPGYVVDVVDTTGAGDAFNGALAVALAEGLALGKAVDFANAAAAMQVTKQGAAPAMPRRDEVETLSERVLHP